jgi:ABC-type multidrug transport system ATPase subunit
VTGQDISGRETGVVMSARPPAAHSQITLNEVTQRYDERVILDRVSLTVSPGEKVGVIGDNGSGKSTLLRLIANLETPDNGELNVSVPGGIGYLAQRLRLPPGGTVGDVVDRALADRRDLEARLRAAEAALGSATPEQLDDYGELLTEFENRGGYEADARMDAALHGLGLPGLERDRAADTLSGGERSRLALAATLAGAPELLLLDEPTNDLDAEAVEWLENQLCAHRGTVVVITHDRMFLETVTSTILEVDADTRAVRRYGDGYTGYLRAKSAARTRWKREYAEWLAETERQTRLAATAGAMLASISHKAPAAFSGAGAHRSRKACDRLDVRWGVGRYSKVGRLSPAAALECVAGRHRREVVPNNPKVEPIGDVDGATDDLSCFLVSSLLEVRVHHVIHRMHGRVGVRLGSGGASVGRDRFVPVAQSREDVGRHVERVRRRRRDIGVPPRGGAGVVSEQR